jgi:hypothetical protein
MWPFGRLQGGNVRYIKVHVLFGRQDSILRANGCTWVRIMYRGCFDLSNSEGWVYITRKIFHLVTQIQIQLRYKNKYIYCTSIFTSLIEQHPTSHTKDNHNMCIHALPDSNIIWQHNSRNVVFAFQSLVPATSWILLSLLAFDTNERQLYTLGLNTIKSITTKWNNHFKQHANFTCECHDQKLPYTEYCPSGCGSVCL